MYIVQTVYGVNFYVQEGTHIMVIYSDSWGLEEEEWSVCADGGDV